MPTKSKSTPGVDDNVSHAKVSFPVMTKPIIDIDAVGDKRVKTTFGGATSIGVANCTGNGCDVDVGFGSLGVKAIVVGLAVVGLESTNFEVASLFAASIPTSRSTSVAIVVRDDFDSLGTAPLFGSVSVAVFDGITAFFTPLDKGT